MSLPAVCAVALLSAVVSLSLRRYNAEISVAVAVCGCAVIFLAVIYKLSAAASTLRSILAAASVNSKYIAILLKTVGVCFLTEFACDCCADAGQRALANNVAIAGKVVVLLTALPLYRDVLDAVLRLSAV